MILMTKFGKFKLRLVATINLAALLSVFNLLATGSKYWMKYVERPSGQAHYAGLWKSCPIEVGDCAHKNGIFQDQHTFWSFTVRFLMSVGSFANIAAILLFVLALFYKINKKSKCALKLMEWGNLVLIGAFLITLSGLCVFVSNKNNFSLWFHVFSLLLAVVSSNLLTRTFASFYFRNARAGNLVKSIENGLSRSKIPCEPEEKVALASETNEAVTEIEMKKVKELGSNEALIPSNNETTPESNNETPNQAGEIKIETN